MQPLPDEVGWKPDEGDTPPGAAEGDTPGFFSQIRVISPSRAGPWPVPKPLEAVLPTPETEPNSGWGSLITIDSRSNSVLLRRGFTFLHFRQERQCFHDTLHISRAIGTPFINYATQTESG